MYLLISIYINSMGFNSSVMVFDTLEECQQTLAEVEGGLPTKASFMECVRNKNAIKVDKVLG